MVVPWQDREIRLDVNRDALKLRAGESLFEKYDNVEDTKANNGERGTLIITCLRVMWVSNSQSRVNICLGLHCITNMSLRASTSVKGQNEAIYVYGKFSNCRYEFIFTSLVAGTTKNFAVLLSVYRAYDISRPYREMRLRAAIIDDGVLRLLPGEVVYHNVDGVFNLTSDSGALGAVIITNIRLVWYSVLNEAFNVSLPYLQIGTITLRESKFGLAIIVETRATSSSDITSNAAGNNANATTSSSSGHTPYVLGFRIDPAEKLQRIAKELKSCHEVYAKNPLFGVDYCMPTNVTALTEAAARAAAAAASDEQLMFDVLRQGTSSRLEAKADKSVSAVAGGGDAVRSNSRSSRYAQRDSDGVFNEQANADGQDDDPDSLQSRPVVYSEELGLAIQKPPAGVTLHDLWMVPT